MVDGPLYSRFIILCLDADGESKSFFFFIDGRASLQILSLLREGRRSEVTKVEENGLKDFFFLFYCHRIVKMEWKRVAQQSPPFSRPDSSSREFLLSSSSPTSFLFLSSSSLAVVWALENICSYTICDDEDGSGLVYVYVNNYRDFKVILSDHCVNAYMRGWCLSNSQRWRERGVDQLKQTGPMSTPKAWSWLPMS